MMIHNFSKNLLKRAIWQRCHIRFKKSAQEYPLEGKRRRWAVIYPSEAAYLLLVSPIPIDINGDWPIRKIYLTTVERTGKHASLKRKQNGQPVLADFQSPCAGMIKNRNLLTEKSARMALTINVT
jgi:hypothetical protein